MNETEYKEIQKLCKKAIKIDCVPVGAIVVLNGKIIGRGYNKKEKTNNPLDHAEIIAIRNSTKKLKSWNLSNCKLIISMIPCEMCKKVIFESRIKQIFYIVDNKNEKSKSIKDEKTTNFQKVNEHMYEQENVAMLKNFFSKKREKGIR